MWVKLKWEWVVKVTRSATFKVIIIIIIIISFFHLSNRKHAIARIPAELVRSHVFCGLFIKVWIYIRSLRLRLWKRVTRDNFYNPQDHKTCAHPSHLVIPRLELHHPRQPVPLTS